MRRILDADADFRTLEVVCRAKRFFLRIELNFDF